MGSIILFIIIVFIYVFIKKPRTPDEYGEAYEKLVKERMERAVDVPVYSNLYFSHNGKTSEVDLCFINNKGIFLIECKHRKDYTDMQISHVTKEAKVMTRNGYEVIVNPVTQNDYHMDVLSKTLDIEKEKMFSVIVTTAAVTYKFLGQSFCTSPQRPFINRLKQIHLCFISYHKKNLEAQYAYDGHLLFREGVNELPDIFSNHDVEAIRKRLEAAQMTDEEKKAFKERKKLQ